MNFARLSHRAEYFTTLGAVKAHQFDAEISQTPSTPKRGYLTISPKPASVTVRIYNIKGELIRSIDVGKQAAGVYTSRQRAAYWDGKDDTGQSPWQVEIYFYQLLADDFSETRRMVVMK